MTSTLSHQFWCSWLLPLLLSLCCVGIAGGQVIDRDTCWTCRDSFEHFVGGAAVDQAAAIVWRKPWQRVTATAAIGVTFEIGQWDAGGGIGLKDIACDIAGALAREAVWALIKRRH